MKLNTKTILMLAGGAVALWALSQKNETQNTPGPQAGNVETIIEKIQVSTQKVVERVQGLKEKYNLSTENINAATETLITEGKISVNKYGYATAQYGGEYATQDSPNFAGILAKQAMVEKYGTSNIVDVGGVIQKEKMADLGIDNRSSTGSKTSGYKTGDVKVNNMGRVITRTASGGWK